MEDQISNVDQPVAPVAAPAAPVQPVAPANSGIPKEQLLKVLTLKQQRALGLIPEAHQSDKVKARNEMMRQRMKEFHKKKAEEKAKAQEQPKKIEKKRAAPPSPKQSEEEESSDDYLQKKSKKIKTVVKTLNQVDQRLRQLHEANQHNPYFKILMR